jgi:RNA polymerase sigma-70 factor (ECF subfamily)
MYDFKTSTSVNQDNTKLDVQGFTGLHDQYGDRLLNSMTGLVRDRDAAAEITASAFAKALKNLRSFRGESSFYTWLHAIARHEIRSACAHRASVSLDAIRDVIGEPGDLVDSLERQEAIASVNRALKQIPAMYRRVLAARFLRGESTRQVAQRLKIPLGTVLSRVSTGKKMLRARLEATP